MVNKLGVTELAELTKMSKSYISQVKHGKKPPSQKLLDALAIYTKPKQPDIDYYKLFLSSREAIGVSTSSMRFYREGLSKYASHVNYLRASKQTIQAYLNTIAPNQYGLATRHASFRVIKTFHRWLTSEYNMPNPTINVDAPILGKPIFPTLTREQVQSVIENALTIRDKAIIALFTESGLRLSELTHIMPKDIDWQTGTIKSVR